MLEYHRTGFSVSKADFFCKRFGADVRRRKWIKYEHVLVKREVPVIRLNVGGVGDKI